jgi:hypothetical protein
VSSDCPSESMGLCTVVTPFLWKPRLNIILVFSSPAWRTSVEVSHSLYQLLLKFLNGFGCLLYTALCGCVYVSWLLLHVGLARRNGILVCESRMKKKYWCWFRPLPSDWYTLWFMCRQTNVTGKDLTPFLLLKVNELMGGKSLNASILWCACRWFSDFAASVLWLLL